MTRRARWEFGVLAILFVAFAIGLIPSLRQSRQEQRDSVRRADVIQLKRSLEIYYNEHGLYPLEFPVGPYQYVITEADDGQALAWFVRSALERPAAPAAAFDLEYNVYWRTVIEGDQSFFDVCGGTSTCGVAKQPRQQLPN